MWRSRAVLFVHTTIHFLMMSASCPVSAPLILLMGKVLPSGYLAVALACLLTVLPFLVVLGTFILSLTIYTFFLDRSIMVAFFHPFLHPFFFFSFFVPSKQIFFYFFTFNCFLFLAVGA
ncbi:hypothetical protein JOM56_014991 [Amanita muscaria]